VTGIKCSYCIRESAPNEAPYLNNGKLSGKCGYYYQVETHLFVCSANYADFVVATFSDASPSLLCDRIFPNERFFKICDLPELLQSGILGRWLCLIRLLQLQWYVLKKLCYCKDDKGEMVGCGSLHALWFHLECLKISKPHCSKWYCPNCRTMPVSSRGLSNDCIISLTSSYNRTFHLYPDIC